MSTLVAADNLGIAEKEWEGQRVVTLKEVDEVHGRNPGTARRSFDRNRSKFVMGTDYYKIPKRELRDNLSLNSKGGNPNLPIILLTKSGYLMLVKSLNDKKAWNIQRMLVDNYFDKQETALTAQVSPVPNLSSVDGLNPQLQMFKALFENAVTQDKRIAENETRIGAVEKKIQGGFELPETTESIDTLFLHPVTLYTTTEIGKAFNLSAKAINRFLLAQDIHHPYKRGWRLNEKYRDCGYVEQKIGYFKTPEGDKEETLMTHWTAKGKDFVCAVLKNAGLKQKGKIKPYDRHAKRSRSRGKGKNKK